MAETPTTVAVVVATPAHSGLNAVLSYQADRVWPAGTLVRVPLGQREVLGVVWDSGPEVAATPRGIALRPVGTVFDTVAPLGTQWRELCMFTARYYQRSLGEIALNALPPALRELSAETGTRRLQRWQKPLPASFCQAHETPPRLSQEQSQALAALTGEGRPSLLFGSTGSGKTEVYLQAAAAVLQADPQAQVLVLVPEINLTPQLETRFRQRLGQWGVVTLHSKLSPVQRVTHWLQAHNGQARIVLGTRMAVFASLPGLRLVVVDEEHDPSYKSQDGARYSARDLAIYRAKLHSQGQAGNHCQVLLGSATPSLESWKAATEGRYALLSMPQRIGGGALPKVHLVDMRQQPKGCVLAPALLTEITVRASRGEQSMLLLNRRGYAPVLTCHACAWTSDCPHCSAHTVFHKGDRSLRCHHCGHSRRVPAACPDCGNPDIAPVGQGTEQLEEQLVAWLSQHQRPDGQTLRVLRMDADTTKAQGMLEQHLESMHQGDCDVLLGTQMIAKGHDFRRITLVASVNADGGLFASDHRAPERLFALLLQAGGRAGRDAAFLAKQGSTAALWVQTWHPQHPLFAALQAHDYPAFAAQQLAERQQAMLPPHTFQALLRAEAKTQDRAQAFLHLATEAGVGLPGREHLVLYPAVPLTIQRVANVERAQVLLESASRPALQAFLRAWQGRLHALRTDPSVKGLWRWAIDVDPVGL